MKDSIKLTACILVMLMIGACITPAFAFDIPRISFEGPVIAASRDEITPVIPTPDELMDGQTPLDDDIPYDVIFDKGTADEVLPGAATPDEEGAVTVYQNAIRITLIDSVTGVRVSRIFYGDDRMANAVKCPVDRKIPKKLKKKIDVYLERVRKEDVDEDE